MKLQIKHIFLLFCFSMLLACNTIEKSQQIAQSTLSKLKISPNTSDDFNVEKIQLLIDKKEYDAAINLLVPEKTSTDAASAKTTASKDEAEKAAKKFSNTVFTNMTDRM